MLLSDTVRGLLEYREGALYWKVHVGANAVPGKRAGYVGHKGYRRIMLNGCNHYEHRLVYLMHHGTMPAFIDHIDGDTSNNVIENLRACTQAENNRNVGRRSDNTSGVKGVYLDRRKGKWHARVTYQGAYTHVGYFTSITEAAQAVKEARSNLHKEFARHF